MWVKTLNYNHAMPKDTFILHITLCKISFTNIWRILKSESLFIFDFFENEYLIYVKLI